MFTNGKNSRNTRNPSGKNQRGMTLPESSFIINPFTFLIGPMLITLKAHIPRSPANIQIIKYPIDKLKRKIIKQTKK